MVRAFLLVAVMITGSANAQGGAGEFTLWTGEGSLLTFSAIADAAVVSDVVLVGEAHDDSVGHTVELKILAAIADRVAADSLDRHVVLSLEMFSRDVQIVLDEYLAGAITEKHFRDAARPWKNYDPDYRPMVEFAKERGLHVLAANTPRRYVNMVSRGGRDALGELDFRARAWLPPLTFAPASDAYADKWNEMMMAAVHHMPADTTAGQEISLGEDERAEDSDGDSVSSDSTSSGMHDIHASLGYMLDAQSLWDAGMAHSIASRLMDAPSSLVVHYVGSFHMTQDSGIQDHLRHYRPGTRTLSILIEPVADVHAFDEDLLGAADVIVLTPEPPAEEVVAE